MTDPPVRVPDLSAWNLSGNLPFLIPPSQVTTQSRDATLQALTLYFCVLLCAMFGALLGPPDTRR